MQKVFEVPGDFQALEAARAWCKKHGFSVGRLQAGAPSGLLHGDYDIQKWRNLSAHDIDALHGTVTGNHRTGPITVTILASSPFIPNGEAE